MEGFWAWPTLGLFAQQAAAVELAWSENKTSFLLNFIMKFQDHETHHDSAVWCLILFPDQQPEPTLYYSCLK